MKRILTLTIMFSLIAAGFSSCTKCYECDFGNGNVKEVCAKDNPDKQEGLQLTIKGYEDQGYKCEAK